MRYINVTAVDSMGTARHTQIVANDPGIAVAIQWMEDQIKASITRNPLIAVFIFDTGSRKLSRYDIDGMRASLRA